MNATEEFTGPTLLAGLGELIHADIRLNHGILRQSPAAKVTNHFTNDTRIALRHIAGPLRL